MAEKQPIQSEPFTERIIPIIRPYARRLQRMLDNGLARLAERERPGPLARSAAAALTRARAALLYNLEGRQGHSEYWQGAEIESGRPLRVAFLGDARANKVSSPQYLRHILFQPASVTVSQGERFAMRRARSTAGALAPTADLVIVEANDLLRWRPTTGVWGWLPTWVRMVFPVHPERPWEEVRAQMRSQKNNIKKARALGLAHTFSRSEEDFEFFFQHLHVPMMRKRHADYGVVDSKETLREQFRSGTLLFVTHDGRRVGGALIYLRGRTAYGIANGVLEGEEALYDLGVSAVEYLESIHWAHQHGYLRYDLGGVRPFANDGLYSFKYRWGAKPEYDVWLNRSWLFWAPNASPAALDWLRAHPAAPISGLLTGPGFPVEEG